MALIIVGIVLFHYCSMDSVINGLDPVLFLYDSTPLSGIARALAKWKLESQSPLQTATRPLPFLAR